MSTLTDVVISARGAGTPLLAVSTPDQFNAIDVICKATDGAPKVQWDALRGLTKLNEAGGKALARAGGNAEDFAAKTQNPQTAFEIAATLPEQSIIFFVNAHRFVGDPFVSTGVLNLRDPYKSSYRTAFLLGPEFDLPAELRSDVVLIDDPLPDDAALRSMIEKITEANGCPTTPKSIEDAVGATRGLSLFVAENTVAMALRKTGIDITELWERKRMQVNQTKGLKLLLSGPTFKDTGGNARLLSDISDIMNGDEPPIAIVWWDEMEKSLGVEGGDSSNVTADFKGSFLSWMENSNHDGIILVGGAGTGKSLAARSVGPQFGLPTFVLDPGAMKGRYVGESETAHRAAFKTINAVACGRVFVIATCNKLAEVSPEIRRRFLSGIYYVDLPNEDERRSIWKVQLEAHALDASAAQISAGMKLSEGWTGAEIRNCCRIAKRQRKTLADAALKIIPVSIASPESIDALRKLATNRFHSANHPGFYEMPDTIRDAVRRVAN